MTKQVELLTILSHVCSLSPFVNRIYKKVNDFVIVFEVDVLGSPRVGHSKQINHDYIEVFPQRPQHFQELKATCSISMYHHHSWQALRQSIDANLVYIVFAIFFLIKPNISYGVGFERYTTYPQNFDLTHLYGLLTPSFPPISHFYFYLQ